MKTQPFYIDAPDFDEGSVRAVQLHVLCDTLNQLGYEAYVNASCTKLSGRLWTPRLTPQVQAAHYKASKLPITVTMRRGTQRQHDRDIGLIARFSPEGSMEHNVEQPCGRMNLSWPETTEPGPVIDVFMPYADPEIFCRPTAMQHTGADQQPLVYAEQFQSHGGQLRQEHADLKDLSPSSAGASTAHERAAWLQQASCLFVYEDSVIATEARLCGCPVVFVSNDKTLTTHTPGEWFNDGARWNSLPAVNSADAQQLEQELRVFRQRYVSLYDICSSQITTFAQTAHDLADALATDATARTQGWPSEILDTLQEWVVDKKDRAAYADTAKYRRMQTQYQTWKKRSSIREIDAQIYAEYVIKEEVVAPIVVIYSNGLDMEPIALTLDSLSLSLLQPQMLVVIAPFDCPIPPQDLGGNVQWLKQSTEQDADAWLIPDTLPHWCLLLEAGVTLEPQATMEFGLAMQAEHALLAYCDDDTDMAGGPVPHFKPDLNIEWLRSVNYLGSAIAVDTLLWSHTANNTRFDSVYPLGLALAAQHPTNAIIHIDSVLAHLPVYQSTAEIQERERREIIQLQHHFEACGLSAQLQPTPAWGARLIEYLPTTEKSISVVIPTGPQSGYLTCLLESFKTYGDASVAEIILVTSSPFTATIEQVVADVALDIAIRIVVVDLIDAGYNHAAALNAGAATATSDLLLFMDDDTECIQRHWIKPLRAYFDQSDIACVSPRLVLQMQKDATLQGGPLHAGADGTLRPYLGERRLLEEQGVFSRLQTTQDVLAVAGHCFMARRQSWEQLGGFDELQFNLFHTVADFCLRARQQNWRHIWSPVSNVVHHGGKTLQFVRHQSEMEIQLRERAMRELDLWQVRWSAYLGQDGSYSRHLSLHGLYEIETDIVLDWPRDRKDRPHYLALPISSGSGQYRVIEPLDAIQSAGLARTCVVYPKLDRSMREPTVLEIARAKPNTLIVQHSIGDHHFSRLRAVRKACPEIFIVQMVDDLFRDLPAKHHLQQVHRREGELRMREAISLSDRLIVSTQPLADAYQKYCSDVRVMPNCLDGKAWGGWRQQQRQIQRQRLRVGWAGAMQHLDDLEMMVDVVKELADEVDWIFMGMCPDSLRPYIKEFHPFVSYSEYPLKLASLKLGIAIAPLQDNRFNESKSNLRLLEYGAMGWPVVCSDVYPFRTMNPPVILVKNNSNEWIDKIRYLVRNEAIRIEHGKKLNEWVNENFTLQGKTDLWLNAFNK